MLWIISCSVFVVVVITKKSKGECNNEGREKK